MYKPEIGTVSHGTLRTEDLIRAFADELERCYDGHLTLVQEARELTDFDSDEAYDLCHDLSEALNEYAPEGTYFGAHEGDGSEFGFWPLKDQ